MICTAIWILLEVTWLLHRKVASWREQSQPYLSSWSLSWRWFSQLLEVLSQLTSYLILSPLHTDPGPWPGSLRILSKRKAPPFRQDSPRRACHSLCWSTANQRRTVTIMVLLGLERNVRKRSSKHNTYSLWTNVSGWVWVHEATDGVYTTMRMSKSFAKQFSKLRNLNCQKQQTPALCCPCSWWPSTSCHPENITDIFPDWLRGDISNNGPPIHQLSLIRAWAAKADHRGVTCSLSLTGKHQRGHRVDMQSGSKGKVTNGAEKLCSKPIFMSAFPLAIRADKHLMWRKEKRPGWETHVLFIPSLLSMYYTVLSTMKNRCH